jgi:hypothetical protein
MEKGSNEDIGPKESIIKPENIRERVMGYFKDVKELDELGISKSGDFVVNTTRNKAQAWPRHITSVAYNQGSPVATYERTINDDNKRTLQARYALRKQEPQKGYVHIELFDEDPSKHYSYDPILADYKSKIFTPIDEFSVEEQKEIATKLGIKI